MGIEKYPEVYSRLKALLEDGKPKDVGFLIAHTEALIPTSEAVRDYLSMANLHPLLKVDPAAPDIPYRSRHWRARRTINSLLSRPDYERIGKQVRKVPRSEELGR